MTLPQNDVGVVMLNALRTVASRGGCRVWLVGGTVRDRELGLSSSDIDVVVEGDAAELAADVAAELGRPWFALSHDFGAYRVAGDGGYLDVASMRGGSLEADLALRDFTVNAMAAPLEGGPPVDPFGGLEHLRRHLLVAVDPAVFQDDSIRLLRAARLAHTLGFSLDSGTEELVLAQAGLLWGAAGERIQSEVVLTLDQAGSAAAVRLWEQIGVLEYLFPEVRALKGVGQSDNHHLDVFGHTLEALESLDAILADPDKWFPGQGTVLEKRLDIRVDGGVSRFSALRLAALLHDSAKLGVRELDDKGNVLFWGHSQEGGLLVEDICRRMRCSRALTALVRRTTEQHLALGFLQNKRPIPRRDLIQYLWDTEPWEPETIMVSVADRQATRGSAAKQEYLDGHLELARKLMGEWANRRHGGLGPLPVDGHVLGRELGLSGPALGAVIRDLALAWEAGELVGKSDALELATRLVRGGGGVS